MDDRDSDRERVREVERTTVVHTDSDRGRGGGLLLAAILLVALLALLFFLFGGSLDRAADEVDVNVNVDAPEVTVPDVDVPEVSVPDVDLSEVEAKEEDSGNQAQ